jgi:hypothetical protein
MAILVDPIFDCPGPNGHTRWSHMGSDDHSERGLAELHKMAVKIGLKRNWFQNKKYHKHYDVTPSKRKLAISYGAIEVSQREYVRRVSTNPALHKLIVENEEAEEAETTLAVDETDITYADEVVKVAESSKDRPMTLWEEFLSNFSEIEQESIVAWVNSKPPDVRELAHRYPPSVKIRIKGKDYFVMGYRETDKEPGLLLTNINPSGDYDLAVKSSFFVCADHDFEVVK